MARLRIVLSIFAVLALPGCGERTASDKEADKLWTAEAVTPDAEAATPAVTNAGGPTLAGGGELTAEARGEPAAADNARTPERGDDSEQAEAYPLATVDAKGQIAIPHGARWRSVKQALELAGTRRAANPQISEARIEQIPLPGVSGPVTVRGATQGMTGLSLLLRDSEPKTKITAIGSAWVIQRGCDTQLTWHDAGWSLDRWREALDALATLRDVPEPSVVLRIGSDVPAAVALRFLDAVGRAGLPPPRIDTSPRYRWSDAVDKAGHWLARCQAPTGSWDRRVSPGWCDGSRVLGSTASADASTADDPALTGLVLLSYLGAGYTHRGKHAFKTTVLHALRYLRDIQHKDGRFPAASGWDDAVAHGFAGLAMVEAYGMTGSPLFKGSAQRALHAIRPTYEASNRGPLALVMSAMVLTSGRLINKSAVKAGKPAPLVLDATLAADLLDDTRTIALGKGDLAAACGIAARILLEGDATADVKAGTAALVHAIQHEKRTVEPLRMYFTTLAANRCGGATWKRMTKLLETRLNDTQRGDGHPCCAKGSWNPPAVATLPGERIAATGLHTLCLQFFYRYDRVFGMR